MNLKHTHELIVDGDFSFMAAPTCAYTASQLGRTAALEPGAGVLMNNAEVGSVRLASSSRFVTFRIPREAMAPLVPNLDDAVARRIPADNPALKLLVDYLKSSRDNKALTTPGLQHVTVNHISDLLAVALGATRDATEAAHRRGMRAARLEAAKAFMLRNCARPELSVTRVAAHLGITPRYLHMLFETEGLTFTKFMVELRLARSYQMLLDRCLTEWTISSIAFATGFSDLSHFNRTFRHRFGMTPSVARRTNR